MFLLCNVTLELSGCEFLLQSISRLSLDVSHSRQGSLILATPLEVSLKESENWSNVIFSFDVCAFSYML